MIATGGLNPRVVCASHAVRTQPCGPTSVDMQGMPAGPQLPPHMGSFFATPPSLSLTHQQPPLSLNIVFQYGREHLRRDRDRGLTAPPQLCEQAVLRGRKDMTYDPTLMIYHYPCPCGDRFEISIDDLRDEEDIATCPSCSLTIRVIFEMV